MDQRNGLRPRLLCTDGAALIGVDGGWDPPGWVRDSHAAFRRMVTGRDPAFPCYFGTVAEQTGALRYTYVEDAELGCPDALVHAVAVFLRTYRAIGARSALIGFLGEPTLGAALEMYEARFWTILQYLHDHDAAPWPASIPVDPDSPDWEFCVGGEPVFITGHAPAYRERRSRGAEGGPFFVLQTLANLQGVIGPGRTAESVRRRIRALASAYDQVPPSQDLDSYSADGTCSPAQREWKMFWLPDSDTRKSGECPLHIRPRAVVAHSSGEVGSP